MATLPAAIAAHLPGESLRERMRRAGKALNEAKCSGRARAHVADVF